MSTNKKSGFTLIEMSIVLVIIGLIVGGVLVGRDLIRAAGIRAAISDINSLTTAINTFTTKYSCLPGDCLNATSFFGTSSGCPSPTSPGTCNGDGDGYYTPWPLESKYTKTDLLAANLWNAGNNVDYTAYSFKIRGLLNQGFAFIFTNDLYSTGNIGAINGYTLNGRTGNTILLSSDSWSCINGVVLTATVAQQIDKKIDDGKATSGSIYGRNGVTSQTVVRPENWTGA